MEYAIGIDVGTTNSKVVLCELPGCNVAHLVKFASPKVESAEGTDFDLNLLEAELIRALGQCAVVAGGSPVRFISIASVGESGALVRPDGSHSDTSIAWFDTRGKEYAEAVHQEGLAAGDYAVTGIPAHANYALFKLLWLREHGEDLGGARWLPLGDYVAWLLCGAVAQDESLASRTFALDVATGGVAEGILGRYGIDPALFPELAESGTMRGPIKREVAVATGLPITCEVAVAGHDHMAGSVACGLDAKMELLNSTGTSEGILTLNEKPVLTRDSFDARLSNGRYVRGGLFSYYASLPTAGFAKAWLAELMAIDEDTFFDVLPARMRERYDAGAFDGRELIFIPHLRGSGPPKRSTSAKGAIYGIRDTTTRDDMFYSCDLGLTFELLNLYRNMIGAPERSVAKVIGPAIKSPLWMQLKADALDIEVRGCRVRESVARGAVMLAAQKLGYAVDATFDCTVFEPRPERHAYLEELFQSTYLPLSNAIAAFEGR